MDTAQRVTSAARLDRLRGGPAAPVDPDRRAAAMALAERLDADYAKTREQWESR
jgi:hypothetical protein